MHIYFIITFFIFKNQYILVFFANTINIMKIKDIINEAFAYKPKNIYQFTLPGNSENPESTTIQNSKPTPEKSQNVFPSLDVNLDYLKTKYNLLINSDIVTREFILNAKGKQYKAFLLFIDGMVDSQILNDYVLEPLMMRNRNNLFNGEQNRVISEAVTNNITVRKVKKFDLADYIESCLVPHNMLGYGLLVHVLSDKKLLILVIVLYLLILCLSVLILMLKVFNNVVFHNQRTR